MDRCWEPPISPPSIHPLHLAKDNFAKHKSDHVTPLLNKPLLLPQRLKDNVLPWKSFMIWPSLFLWPYMLSLFYYHFSIALFNLVNSQESRATWLLRADYPLLSSPALFSLLWTPGWFLLILQDSTLRWLPLGSLSWPPSQAGLIFCPSGHPALYYRSQQSRKNMNSEVKETWIEVMLAPCISSMTVMYLLSLSFLVFAMNLRISPPWLCCDLRSCK